MTVDRKGAHRTPESSRGIPAKWTLEIQSVARIVVGFLVFRHGMEQVLGFPAAGTDVPTASLYGLLKLLCLPGGLLLMLGRLTRPTTLALAIAHVVYWFIEPLPQAVFEGARLFGSRGAPSDHLLLPGLFCAYLYLLRCRRVERRSVAEA